MSQLKRLAAALLFVSVLGAAGVSFSEEPAERAEGEAERGRLILAAPENEEIGFGSWDGSVTGGQAPSWAYLVSLREKFIEGSWENNSAKAMAIYFFNSGAVRKKIELPWKPSSVSGSNTPDERAFLDIGIGGKHLTYHHIVLGPMLKNGARPSVFYKTQVLDHKGALIREGNGPFVGAVSADGKYGVVGGAVVNLNSGENLRYARGGYPMFSRYDDSYVVYHSGKDGLEYYDSDGRSRWRGSLGEGITRNVVVSPGGQYIYAAIGNDKFQEFIGVFDASGKVLWRVPVSVGVYQAAFSKDGRYLAVVTRSTNWIFESATGKVLATEPMPKILGDENAYPGNAKVYVLTDMPSAVVIARTARFDQSSQSPMPGHLLKHGDDVVYEYDSKGGRVVARLPSKSIIVAGAGFAYEPVATVSPDGQWLYYLTPAGLFAKRIE